MELSSLQHYVLCGLRIIDPANARDARGDIGIADGIFVLPETIPQAPRINLDGLLAAPGFIDLHVHLRDPGQTTKEDLQSGTRAAVAGGFTTLVAMANTTPPIDRADAVSAMTARIRQETPVRVLQTAALTENRQGRRLTDFKALQQAGAIALTDDGTGLQDTRLMRQAMEQAAAVGLPIIDHCENTVAAAKGLLHAGPVSRLLQIAGSPAAAEDIMVARNILLARDCRYPIHLQHVSSAGACSLLRWALQQQIPVTAEVTPHHLCLNDTAFFEHKANAKMNPPLRGESDRRHILQALRQGNIAAVATDHAPHTQEEKDRELTHSPFGIIGLETAIPLCLTMLVHGGVLNLMQFIAKFTALPRQILKLPYGTLSPGSPADLTLLDLHQVQTINSHRFHSRSRNSPFHSWQCRGAIAGTIINGTWRYCNILGINNGESSIL